MRTKRDWMVRSSVLIVSLVTCGAGTALYVNAALGNDPMTAFIQGLSIQASCSYGTAMNVLNVIAVLFVFAFDRRFIHFGTVLSLALGGFISDVFITALARLLGPEPQLAVRMVLLLAGTVFVGFGVGLYQAARLGISPLDALNQIISARLNLPLRYERMLCDALFLICALLLGGTVFVGTVISLLLVGPIMAYVLQKMSPLVDGMVLGTHNK